MMGRRVFLGVALLLLGACAPAFDDAVVLAEPVAEEAAEAAPVPRCPAASDDGIGGTGCSAD